MVELVDTQDLKSCDLKSRAGSIPALSTRWEARSERRDFPFLFIRNFYYADIGDQGIKS